jgi:subtilisin family serine protease
VNHTTRSEQLWDIPMPNAECRRPKERQTIGVLLSSFRILPWLAALLFVSLFSASSSQNAESSSLVRFACETPDAQNASEANASSLERIELMERLGVPAWQTKGWHGRGLKIAVLDSGFHGYRTYLGAALPRSVTVRSFRYDGNLEAKESQHGILCAEVIHALAPEAELLLANWEAERPDQFLAAVRWARQEGARIISCSIIMPTWSDCEGHGRIHEELTRLLGSGERTSDALFFASAGNTAQRHWSGPFQDDGNGYHVWHEKDGVAERDNIIRPWGRERISVELCCPVTAGFEVSVIDATARQTVGRSSSKVAAGAGSAVVAFMPEQGHEYRVRVRRLRGAEEAFHVVVLGGALRFSRSAGSIPFPGDGSEVIAVGAVDATGKRLAYSSCGARQGGAKPDFVATVPFPSSWRSRPFSGTSAAAPQASALAALVWSRHPDWNAAQIHTILSKAARRYSPSSPLWETGHGLLRLPAASQP